MNLSEAEPNLAKRSFKVNTVTLFTGGDALKGHTRSHPEHDG